MLRGFVYAFSMHKWKISAIFEHAGELLATQYFHVRTDTSYDRLEFHENISTVERKHAKEYTLFFCCYMPISWYWSFCCENRNQANHSLKVKFCNRISSINIDWVREFSWRSRNLWMQKKEQPNQNGWTVDRRAQRLHTNTHKWASLASNVLRTRCHVGHWHFAWILVTQHESKCYLMHHNFLLAMRNGIRHRALLQMKQACWIYHLDVIFCVSLVGAHDAGSRMDRTCAKEFERIRFESPGKYETFALRDSLLLNIASNRIEFKSQQNVENYSTTDSQDHLCDFVQKRRETSKISWICTHSHMLCLSCNKFSCYSPSDFIWN